jgi:enoyl-CoA hydratase/carnithine racemase
MTTTVAGSPLEVEQRQRVRWLWLNRPERRNALDEALIEAFDGAIGDAERDPGTDVLVIAGTGPSFCAGADLEALLAYAEAGRSPLGFLERVSATFSRLERSPLPVVAALHGHAVAGGLELALAADVVVAAGSTLIGDGHLRNGLVPGGGSSVRLPRKVGAGKARWLLLTGELVPAAALAGEGWLHSLVPDHRLQDVADQLAGRLAEAAGPSQSLLKGLLAEIDGEPPEAALRRELEVIDENWDAQAIAARLRAFLAGRRPEVAGIDGARAQRTAT